MSGVRARGKLIRRYILHKVQANPRTISKLASRKFGISRQAVNGHLRRLVEEGALTETGKTSSRAYKIAGLLKWNESFQIDADLAEDVVWRDNVEVVLGKHPNNVRDIWNYGFTEILNNARDHSEGTTVRIEVERTAVASEMMIADDGVGIFRKIQRNLNLLDERHALLELSKGKLTTDPKRHTGQGIFFASRMFDDFRILSGGVFFSHNIDKDEDWLLERPEPRSGTAVFMKLGNHTSRTPRQVFGRFSGVGTDDYAFNKTIVPVRLAQYGNDKLISRSQAKRVLARVELFKTVILNFGNVPTIGQAFADEVFRIFPRDHPEVDLVAISTNSEVKRMIERVKSEAPEGPGANETVSEGQDQKDEGRVVVIA